MRSAPFSSRGYPSCARVGGSYVSCPTSFITCEGRVLRVIYASQHPAAALKTITDSMNYFRKEMTRYKKADFEEDISSIGSVQLTEGVSSTATHIRYHTGTTFWKSRTSLEKCLIVSVVSLLLIVFILTLALSATGGPSRYVKFPKEPPNVCLTPECVQTAAGLMSSIDLSVDPCDDFYQYACGNWIKANPIPDGKSMWGTFVQLEQRNQLVLKTVLERPIEGMKSKAEKKAKLYYLSCMDANETIESRGGEPMLALIKETGGWSIAGDFDVSSFSLQAKLQTLQNKYNMGGLFSWSVQEDDKNSSLHIIQVDQGGLTLPTRDKYLNKTANEKLLDAYWTYMTDMGTLLGGEKKKTKKLMKDVLDFETRLAEVTIPDEERRDEEKMYHQMRIGELQEFAPLIDWFMYFSDAFRTVQKKISDKDRIVVYAPSYLKNLSLIVEEYSKTKQGNETLNNYLVWQMVNSLRSCLSKSFRDTYKGVKKALLGTEGGEESWRYCVQDTNTLMGFAVGAMYVREAFHDESKAKAEQMISDVRVAFKENLKRLQWMDPETRKLAEEKADAITDMIGYPDFILDPKQLDEKYKDLDIKENNYFQNNVNANTYTLKQNLKQLGQPVNRTRWSMTPPTVNAYYTPNRNQIAFPAGILQSPFYDVRHTPALNFGAMGVVMGHELTHAFDDQGREYDKFGNMHQWWKNDTIEKFNQQTSCVVKQYSNYIMNDKHINGKQTLGENIADNGGLKAAFRAYTDWAAANPPEQPLPGLNLTHSQLFFLSFAQVWCSASTEEAADLHVEKDTHSVPKFRVKGSLSNLPEFATHFGCKPGAAMNPKEKCEVW